MGIFAMGRKKASKEVFNDDDGPFMHGPNKNESDGDANFVRGGSSSRWRDRGRGRGRGGRGGAGSSPTPYNNHTSFYSLAGSEFCDGSEFDSHDGSNNNNNNTDSGWTTVKQKKKPAASDKFDPSLYGHFKERKYLDVTNNNIAVDQVGVTNPNNNSKVRNNEQFSIMSYNVLAQCYAKAIYFPHANREALRWKIRSDLIMFEIATYNADIICMQEVDNFNDFYKRRLERLGYECVYHKRTRQKKDGCLTCFKSDKFRLVKTKFLEFNELAQIGQHIDPTYLTDNVAIVTLLQRIPARIDHENTNDLVVIANSHIFWDPTYPHVKIAQAHALVHECAKFIRVEGVRCPIILCGDFNALPDSNIYHLLTKRSTSISVDWLGKRTLIDMDKLAQQQQQDTAYVTSASGAIAMNSALQYVPPKHRTITTMAAPVVNSDPVKKHDVLTYEHDLVLESSYAQYNKHVRPSSSGSSLDQTTEPDFTNYTHKFIGTLDYIMFTPTVPFIDEEEENDNDDDNQSGTENYRNNNNSNKEEEEEEEAKEQQQQKQQQQKKKKISRHLELRYILGLPSKYEIESISGEKFLPSIRYPSDHLAICSVFEWSPQPQPQPQPPLPET